MKIFDIFKRDVAKIFKSKVAVIIMIGMTIIPGIYAWLNIDSNWNPYDNTGNIEFAVVNNDKGVTVLDNNVNIGDSLTEKLKTNTAMKWIFTDEETAKSKVESGEYYGAIILPEDFSEKITTLFDGTEIVKPEFIYYVNNKKNAIAPIITTKAVGTLETTLDQAFVSTVVFKAIDKAESMDVADKGVQTIDSVIMKLSEAKGSVGQLRSTLGVVAAAADATSNALSAVKDLLPNAASFSELDPSSARLAFNSLSEMSGKVDENVGAILDAADELSEQVSAAIEDLEIGDAKAKEKIEKIMKVTEALRTILNREQEVISSLRELTGRDVLSLLERKNERALQKLAELDALLSYASEHGTLILDQIKNKCVEVKDAVSDARGYYHNGVENVVNAAINDVSTKLNGIVDAFSFTANAFSKTDLALSSTINALNSTGTMNSNIDVLLGGLENDIDEIIKILGTAGESDLYLKILNLLQNTPEDVADFISKPIKTSQIDLYPIEDYGSKMAPFYTILAAWVGCTLLVSILKVDVEKDKRTKPYQAFFGRFLLFGTIAAIQGLVIGIGDIVMGVQVLNVPLFLLAIMLSSVVFMLIVFSLTISFGKVGEAMAVVLMVIQVAGSGGTFPIELLPNFFQNFQPFMPFYPAMNAVRETVGGFYGATYLANIGLLLCHTIIPLGLGLVIRKPIMKLKAAADESIEETGVIV